MFSLPHSLSSTLFSPCLLLASFFCLFSFFVSLFVFFFLSSLVFWSVFWSVCLLSFFLSFFLSFCLSFGLSIFFLFSFFRSFFLSFFLSLSLLSVPITGGPSYTYSQLLVNMVLTTIYYGLAPNLTTLRMCPPLTTRNWAQYKPLVAIGNSGGGIQVYNLATRQLYKDIATHTCPVR